MIDEIIFCIKVWIIIISLNIGNLAIVILLDELQTINHTTICSERILLTLDSLKFTSIDIARSICIIPCIFVIIVLTLIQIFSSNYLEPTLAYTRTVFNRVEISPCLRVFSGLAIFFIVSKVSSS